MRVSEGFLCLNSSVKIRLNSEYFIVAMNKIRRDGNLQVPSFLKREFKLLMRSELTKFMNIMN